MSAEKPELSRFGETAPVSADPAEEPIRKPTDEELWQSLVGIFSSGDRHSAERHDKIYRRVKKAVLG